MEKKPLKNLENLFKQKDYDKSVSFFHIKFLKKLNKIVPKQKQALQAIPFYKKWPKITKFEILLGELRLWNKILGNNTKVIAPCFIFKWSEKKKLKLHKK